MTIKLVRKATKNNRRGYGTMLYQNEEFYPTPSELAMKMAKLVDMERVKYVLEPSAGKGDLIEALKNLTTDRLKHHFGYSTNYQFEVDCIEKDENLSNLLKGKEYSVVYDDFLDFNTHKSYDLIIMNPPFSNGDKHLLKAISLIKYGGQIVCLLNAETIKNPYSNIRKDLIKKLEELDAKIEFIEESFTTAERKTNVEVALVYININAKEPISLILDNLEEPQCITLDFAEGKEITYYDVVRRMIQQYEYEIKVGIKFIEEYCRALPYFCSDLKEEHTSGQIIELKVCGKNFNGKHENANAIINKYVERVRYKYWYALGDRPEMKNLMTSNLRDLYNSKISELKEKEFNLHNIKLVEKELFAQLDTAVEETILNLFDEFTKPHWYSDCGNIHYYNGWATNKAHKINKKVILPINANTWGDELRVNSYEVQHKLSDIEKTMDYLNDGRISPSPSISAQLSYAERMGITRNIDTKYFTVTFYKKGTCHLVFKSEELLQKFNIIGGQKKGWLPPNYGKKHYNEMTKEEQEVIDSFHDNILEYEDVVNEKEFYLVASKNLLALTA